MSAMGTEQRRFGDIARRLASLYEDSEEGLLVESGIIYGELRLDGERYTERKVLAQGGMKTISRVFDTKTGRHVAMAELRGNAPQELYEPFLREARLSALLEHPNIISIHDIGLSDEGVPYFTMDLKRGETLETFIHKKRLPLNTLLEIFVKICDAISYAHSQKVLHLDLKPANIQVGRFGEVFVCDWGLGRVIGSDESDEQAFDQMLFNPDLLNNMTLSGSLKGTPGFMAPEQLEKGGKKTVQTDVYALGCILYAMLIGHAPLEGELETVCEKTRTGQIISPARAYPRRNVPRALNAVVMKALALKAGNRYPSADVLRDEVKSFLGGRSTLAEKAGLLKEILLFYKRNRAACVVGLISLGLIMVGTTFFIRSLQEKIVEVRKAGNLAESKRREAELASARYREEITRNMRIMESFGANPIKEFWRISGALHYSDPVLGIKLAFQRLKMLKEIDPSASVEDEMGYSYFIKQDFSAAADFIGDEGWYKDLLAISRDYSEKTTDEGVLSVDDFVALIKRLKLSTHVDRRPLMEKMLVYDAVIRTEKSRYECVVEAVLRGWNRNWTKGRFDYDRASQKLVLRGEQLADFALFTGNTSWESPLRFIPIESLDVRQTGLEDLSEIKDLCIRALDIRETNVTDLSPIHLFPNLEVLVVEKGSFSAEQLAAMPGNLKIIQP